MSLVKSEKEIIGAEENESINEPLNFKLSSINDSSSKDIPMDHESPNAMNESPVETDTCGSMTQHSSAITSTTKVYANLESAMPVEGISSQPPITIQTIEVIKVSEM